MNISDKKYLESLLDLYRSLLSLKEGKLRSPSWYKFGMDELEQNLTSVWNEIMALIPNHHLKEITYFNLQKTKFLIRTKYWFRNIFLRVSRGIKPQLR